MSGLEKKVSGVCVQVSGQKKVSGVRVDRGFRCRVSGERTEGGFRFQCSAPPPSKKTAGQIEKETLKSEYRISINECRSNEFCLFIFLTGSTGSTG